MCQIKTEHNVGLVRLEAMHKRTPVFNFMFGKDGNLLNSNAAAMTKFGVKSVGKWFHICNILTQANSLNCTRMYVRMTACDTLLQWCRAVHAVL